MTSTSLDAAWTISLERSDSDPGKSYAVTLHAVSSLGVNSVWLQCTCPRWAILRNKAKSAGSAAPEQVVCKHIERARAQYGAAIAELVLSNVRTFFSGTTSCEASLRALVEFYNTGRMKRKPPKPAEPSAEQVPVANVGLSAGKAGSARSRAARKAWETRRKDTTKDDTETDAASDSGALRPTEGTSRRIRALELKDDAEAC